MYWKNEALAPLSEGNQFLSEGIPSKQVRLLSYPIQVISPDSHSTPGASRCVDGQHGRAMVSARGER
ncbi:hypothetical protein cypCar_00008130 [Cyprinus carpio]|nr:hypothetical protein cypCar_00008130 [Cyprinus carpio]